MSAERTSATSSRNAMGEGGGRARRGRVPAAFLFRSAPGPSGRTSSGNGRPVGFLHERDDDLAGPAYRVCVFRNSIMAATNPLTSATSACNCRIDRQPF